MDNARIVEIDPIGSCHAMIGLIVIRVTTLTIVIICLRATVIVVGSQ